MFNATYHLGLIGYVSISSISFALLLLFNSVFSRHLLNSISIEQRNHVNFVRQPPGGNPFFVPMNEYWGTPPAGGNLIEWQLQLQVNNGNCPWATSTHPQTPNQLRAPHPSSLYYKTISVPFPTLIWDIKRPKQHKGEKSSWKWRCSDYFVLPAAGDKRHIDGWVDG